MPIEVVIDDPAGHLDAEKMTESYEKEGVLVNSDKFDGTKNLSAMESITDYMEKINRYQGHTLSAQRLAYIPPEVLGRAYTHNML